MLLMVQVRPMERCQRRGSRLGSSFNWESKGRIALGWCPGGFQGPLSYVLHLVRGRASSLTLVIPGPGLSPATGSKGWGRGCLSLTRATTWQMKGTGSGLLLSCLQGWRAWVTTNRFSSSTELPWRDAGLVFPRAAASVRGMQVSQSGG